MICARIIAFYLSVSGHVTTIAGQLTSGYLDAMGTLAKSNGPYGVTIDTIGTLYVADTLNHMLRKITTAGIYLC